MPASQTSILTPGILKLWDGIPPAMSPGDDFEPFLELYLLDDQSTRGTVLVFPGGGYTMRAPHEAEPIARRFNEAGFHAAVCQYRVSPHRHPAPLLDASRAIRMLRANAAGWGIDPGHIAIIGFSAGGHLAASLSVHYAMPELHGIDDLDTISARPDASILCYPVISSGPNAHQGSFINLLGEQASEEMLKRMSLDRQVNTQTPPAFLWHTADDAVVPVENSLLYASALSAHKLPFELHVFPHGVHGLGLAPDFPHIAQWMPLCIEWLYELGFPH